MRFEFQLFRVRFSAVLSLFLVFCGVLVHKHSMAFHGIPDAGEYTNGSNECKTLRYLLLSLVSSFEAPFVRFIRS